MEIALTERGKGRLIAAVQLRREGTKGAQPSAGGGYHGTVRHLRQ
jgi:hypothetical protein